MLMAMIMQVVSSCLPGLTALGVTTKSRAAGFLSREHPTHDPASLAQEHAGGSARTGDARAHNLYRGTRAACDVHHHGVQYFLPDVFAFLTAAAESSEDAHRWREHM